jgi:pimeloyl-ACP methyl ester carboxylesterase
LKRQKECAVANPAIEKTRMVFREVRVDGVQIAYREGGPADAPVVLLLHGVPSSSRMYDRFMRSFGNRYRFIAPDLPGFGNSGAPPPSEFVYTFDHLAEVMLQFADALGITRCILFMHDYGAPVGMRMALARPNAVQAVIFQNGNVYLEGLGAMWETRKNFWRDRASLEAQIRAGHLSLPVTRGRHIGGDPDIEAYDPDLWLDELAYLHRPGQEDIQIELIYDYRTNIDAYPAWQAWLRTNQPPCLVVWGKYDLGFIPAGAEAFAKDLPKARIEIIGGGHFVTDTHTEELVALTREFLDGLALA